MVRPFDQHTTQNAPTRPRFRWLSSVNRLLSLSSHRVSPRQSLPLSHPSSRVQSSQLYPSADTVVILDATSLRLVRTLAFSQVFPSRDHANARISSLVVDPTLKLVCNCSPITLRFPLIAALPLPQVAAASGPRFAVWSLSGVSARTWLVHSSLLLPDDEHITALDCRSGVFALLLCPRCHCPLGAGLLAVATQLTLSVYTLIMENDLPTWSRKWTRRYHIPQ